MKTPRMTSACAITFTCLLLVAPLTVAYAVTPSERQALTALYNSTNGDSWTNNTGWKTPPLDEDGFSMPGTEGTWYGVALDTGGNVIGIGLNYNNLTGVIPTSLGSLVNLVNMDMYGNSLTGPIPSTLGVLSNLQRIWLTLNQLNGPIPPELGDLVSLRYLYLDGNQLSGSIPDELGNLSNLYCLRLRENQFSGAIPITLGSLSSLEEMELQRNQLTGSIPSELGDLGNLRYLELSANHLSGLIPAELANASNLVWISLINNEFTGSIPSNMGGLSKLAILALAENQLSGPIPVELGNLANLMELYLYSNLLTGSIPSELGGLNKLTQLQLHSNQLGGAIPATFGNLTSLRGLNLKSNKLQGPIPSSLTNLVNLVNYATDISYNALFADDPNLDAFLNNLQPSWSATQTIAPGNVSAETVGGSTARVLWTQIAYTQDPGGYIVAVSDSPGGPYVDAGQTGSKSETDLLVTGLQPAMTYYFTVRTHTDAHSANNNAIDSQASAETHTTMFAQYSIQGKVLLGGAPLANVVLEGLPGPPVTGASGDYYASVENSSWSGTVTPILAGYTFTPPSRTYSGVPQDQLDQDYTATQLPVTITMTSPNGGEIWAAGTTQDITWTQTGLSGPVTIDLCKGGVYQKTLGTAEAAAGTFSWAISAGEPPGADYRVLVWQGSISDQSDDDFAIGAAIIRKDDLVGTWDGQGVYYRNSDSGSWVRLASPATIIATGDLDCDGIDDLIGVWPGQGGLWVKLSSTGQWIWLAPTPRDVGAYDMDEDGCDEIVGTWDGQGVFILTAIGGPWIKIASPADQIAVGDIDCDGIGDLLGLWPSQGGIWVKYSSTGAWARLSSTAVHIGAGDMNGDGRDDLLGTWDGQGVYYRDSITGAWVKLASEATLVKAGDIDGDGMDDLIGIWPTQGGVWVKYSLDDTWERLSSTARDIAAGKMRPASPPAPMGAADEETSAQAALELPFPIGGNEEGPAAAAHKKDLTMDGPGGWRFVYLEERNLEPQEDSEGILLRTPAPGEPGFIAEEQKNLFPGVPHREKQVSSKKNQKR